MGIVGAFVVSVVAVVKQVFSICVVIVVGCCAAALGGFFHLVQIFFGKEAFVAQQCLVHRAQLVDGQKLVADPPSPLAPPPAARQRHEANNGLPDIVRELHLGQQRHGGFVKQAAV